MIWFTSDLHLGHRVAISMCERPFETVEEMNEILICNINSCVKKNDTVYILGDIAHRTQVDVVNQWIARMNGKKILCKGNHDKKYNVELFAGIYDFLEIMVHGVNVSLMHYPMMSWSKSRHGSLHLHGTFIVREIIICNREKKVYCGMTWVWMRMGIIRCR